MADISHFDMVGFSLDVSDGPALMRSAEPYARTCKPTELSAEDVGCLVHDASGGELRLGLRRQPDGSLTIWALNPAFDGEGRMPIVVDSDVSDPDWKSFEVGVMAHFSSDNIPVVFDLADPTQAKLVTPGTTVTAEITAFSYAPEIFDSEASYYRAQTGKVPFASSFFIPSGTFTENAGGLIPEGSTRPLPYADFAGVVLKAEMRTNGAGRGRFCWALVQTANGATIDVVMAESTVKSAPKAGSIIAGRFWLSGRLLPH